MQDYGVWMLMKSGCVISSGVIYSENNTNPGKVCERWSEFDNFVKDMGRRPTADYSLERIDETKGFEKDNCRWIKRKNRNNIKIDKDD